MYIGLSLAENVSSIAIAMQLMMPFSVLLAVVFLGEQIGPRRILGIVLALVGVIVLGFDPVVFNHIEGLLFCVTAAFVAATGLVLMRTLKGVGVYQLQAWVGALSAPQLLLLSLIFEWHALPGVADASWLAWAGMAYTAIGASLLGHAGWYWLLQRYEVQLMSPIGLLASVWAVIFGVTIFGDTLSDKLLLGGAMTLTGVLIVMLLQDRPREVEAVSEPNA
jgi:O-acetylserine/cysteine efflux transporter